MTQQMNIGMKIMIGEIQYVFVPSVFERFVAILSYVVYTS